MLTIDQRIADADDGNTELTGTALVPVTAGPERLSTIRPMSRPDPTFVAHLIATAERLPQTRNLRRATPSDALSAYAARLQPAQRTGRQTRQII
jgi:hypothetical protein